MFQNQKITLRVIEPEKCSSYFWLCFISYYDTWHMEKFPYLYNKDIMDY